MPLRSPFVKASYFAVAALLSTALYEAATLALFPRLSRWQFYTFTIAYCTVIVFAVAAFMLRRVQPTTAALTWNGTNLDTLIEHMPGFACVVKDGRFLRCGSRFRKVLGYSAEELSHLPAPLTLAPEFRDIVPQRMKHAFETGHAETEAAWLTRQGKRIP